MALDVNTNLADAFEKSSSASDFLDLIILKVSKAVDELEEADNETDSRKFSRMLKGLQFISDLVESKKKMETNTGFSMEKMASVVLRYFLKELNTAMSELHYSEDDIIAVFQVLQNRISNWEDIKKQIEKQEQEGETTPVSPPAEKKKNKKEVA